MLRHNHSAFFVKEVSSGRHKTVSLGYIVGSGDYHSLIIDKKVVGGFIRYNKTDFRSNYGENASSRPLKEGDKCFKLASYIAKELDIEYAGIDFMFLESGEPILCEINSNAFFEEFEKVTGINVAKEYALMIKRKIYEQE